MSRLTRRQFIKLTSLGALGLTLGWELQACGDGAAPSFFTGEERATLEAAAARILPADGAVALETGAVPYIERLLTAFEHDPPLIFAGGPFSGRLPFPDNDTGQPSDGFPEDEFERFLPLSRTREIAWRVRLYGSGAIDGGDVNDAVLGPTEGWRDVYRRGLQELEEKARELHGAAFAALTPEQQDEALAAIDQAFVDTLAEHVVEGAYAAPEYGGNIDLSGWRALAYDGDSQPLGYSVFDRSTGTYHELADKPLSEPNPDEDFAGLDEETLTFVNAIVKGTGGERFF